MFPIIETVHIFGIILLVGATSILDLRLMGLTFRDESVSKLAGRFIPWAVSGFRDSGGHRVSAVLFRSHEDVRQPGIPDQDDA